MSPGKSAVKILQTNLFKKAYEKFAHREQDLIDDQILRIVAEPSIGSQKKGDLSHVRVLKFSVNSQQVLLGYSWQQKELHLYLLNVRPHENFYKDLSKRPKADIKIIK